MRASHPETASVTGRSPWRSVMWRICGKRPDGRGRRASVSRGLIDLTPSAISLGMTEGARGVRIAHVQDQALRAFRQPRGNTGWGSVRCSQARRTRVHRCRPRRRCHQAANRAQGSGPVRRVPCDRAVSPGRAFLFRLRIREERAGQSSAGRVESVPSAGGRDARNGRGCPACGAFERDDSRGDLR